MHDQLGERLRARAERIAVPPGDLDEVVTGGRRRLVIRRMVAVAGVATLAALAVLFVRADVFDGNLFEGNRQQPAERFDRQQPPERSEGTFADVHGWIAYRTGLEIRAVDPANPTERLVIGSSNEADPIAWSQDGSRLLLRPHPELSVFFEDGGWGIGIMHTESPLDLFVLESNGSRTRLTPGGERSGTWGSFSPDGRKVVYACCGGGRGPYITDVDGEGQPRLLADPCGSCDGEPFAEWAAWSPDGSRIAFIDFWEDHPTYGHHAYTLSFLDPDNGDTLGEVVHVDAAGGPAWSPDGSQLAFWAVVLDEDADPSNATLGPGGDFPAQIFVINADGSGLRQITDTGDNRWPTWSPNGSRIAFARGELTVQTAPDGSQASSVIPGSRQLFTMAPDGSDVQMVEGVAPGGPIAWNPVR